MAPMCQTNTPKVPLSKHGYFSHSTINSLIREISAGMQFATGGDRESPNSKDWPAIENRVASGQTPKRTRVIPSSASGESWWEKAAASDVGVTLLQITWPAGPECAASMKSTWPAWLMGSARSAVNWPQLMISTPAESTVRNNSRVAWQPSPSSLRSELP